MHSTTGELSAARVQSCTSSLDQAGLNQQLLTRTVINSICRTRIQWFRVATDVFCVTVEQCGVLVRAVEHRYCQKRMASFLEGSVFTRLGFCLFVLLGTAVLSRISDLQVEIPLGSLGEGKMVFHLFAQYSFVRRFCFWNFKTYHVNSKNVLICSVFLMHKIP